MNPLGSYIYRTIHSQHTYDPDGGRISIQQFNFYKYVMPLALRNSNLEVELDEFLINNRPFL
jgi:hypothetical protein